MQHHQPESRHEKPNDEQWGTFTKSTVTVYASLLLMAVAIIVCVAYASPSSYASTSQQHSDADLSAQFLSPAASITGALKPKVLGDINPLRNEKLQRLMHRNFGDRGFLRNSKKNKLNKALHGSGRLSPLKSLSDLPQANTKEISFELEVGSLPRDAHRQTKPTVFIRQVFPQVSPTAETSSNRDVVLLFLHGASYTSATWSELGILAEFARQGYTSYALDLPGFGQSTQSTATNDKWLREVLDALTTATGNQLVEQAGGRRTNGTQFVLVTASMSGQYAIPLLFETPRQLVGMITVAPVHTGRYSKEEYAKVKIPVCIVYGENDAKLGLDSKKNLVNIPNHEVIVVPNGDHAAYKSNPKYFHRHIVKWLAEFFD